MRLEDLKKFIRNANVLHKARIYIKRNAKGTASLWVYSSYKRETLGLPSIPLNSKTNADEQALLRKAVELRGKMEKDGDDSDMSKADRKIPASKMLGEWVSSYVTESGRKNARLAMLKFLEANEDIPVGVVGRKNIIRMMDALKKQNYHSNYIRTLVSRFRAFTNWAEQRGYMGRVDTRRLLPPEQFGEVRALGEDELRMLAAAPCDACPDVKDLFMLGVYTAQRVGEIKSYAFKMLYDGKIKARQGKTGKFIVIPLSENALAIMRGLKARRESEGKNAGENDKMFCLPSHAQVYRIFKGWLEAAGIDRNRITLHNSRSTAISLLINKGVSESVTQELANHADPRITARYYRQIDDTRKKEALDLIPAF